MKDKNDVDVRIGDRVQFFAGGTIQHGIVKTFAEGASRPAALIMWIGHGPVFRFGEDVVCMGPPSNRCCDCDAIIQQGRSWCCECESI